MRLTSHLYGFAVLVAAIGATAGCGSREPLAGSSALLPTVTEPPPSTGVSPHSFPKVMAPWGIAVDATTIYVAAQGIGPSYPLPLISIPMSGGAATVLASGSSFTVAIDATHVYWNDGHTLFSCAKQSCSDTAAPLATVSGQGIAVDDTSVYYVNGGVMKVDKQGGTPVLLAISSYPYQIAVDAQNVYWTDNYGPVLKVPTTGGAPVVLGTGTQPMGIALDDRNVYYTTSDGKVMKVAKSGGTVQTLARDLGNEPWGIATDGVNVYAAAMGNGTIVKVPAGGGAQTVLASGLMAPAGITVDATSVYWTDVDAGTVTQAAK